MNTDIERFGPWAVVTGASSGIGEAFARQLASVGLNLVLIARRQDRLHRLASELEAQHGIETRIVAVDLAREDFLVEIERTTGDLDVGLVINNAGFATSGAFLDNDVNDEVAMLYVNARAPLVLAHHFGKLMRRRGQGGLIFVSSILGFAGVPSWSHYAATKAFDHVLAEGLARELQRDGVSVLAVAPGPTRTPFWSNTTNKLLPFTTAERVARLALHKLGRQASLTVGGSNKLIVFSTRLLPRSWNAWIFGLVVRLLRWATASHETTPDDQQPVRALPLAK